MEINLSRQQFEALLKVMSLGIWMVNGIRAPGNEIREFAELEQHLLSLGHEAGFTGFVERDPDLSQCIPTKAFEELLDPFIDEYDDEAFWDGLVERLAHRDFAEAYGDDAARMGEDEHAIKLQKFVEQYETEIEQHGIDRLRITRG